MTTLNLSFAIGRRGASAWLLGLAAVAASLVGLATAVHAATDWNQLGSDVVGEAPYDAFGQSVAISADGTIAIVGARFNDGGAPGSGHARVYELEGDSWTQLGSDLDGQAANARAGQAVAMSADGSTVLVGAPFSDGNGAFAGSARIYRYDGEDWAQLGPDIDGQAGEWSALSVAMNGDGSRVAIGAPATLNNGTGTTRVYQFDGDSWVQLGPAIVGESAGDGLGWSVAMSADGTIVAAGAPFNDGNGESSGLVRLYRYDGTTWGQLGSDIDGEAPGDRSGDSLALSADGDMVVIGADWNDGNGDQSGHARVYRYQVGAWVQVGSDIDGAAAHDSSGFDVSMSADGNTVAIGSPAHSGGEPLAGQVRVYRLSNGEWFQFGEDIDGTAEREVLGLSVSLNASGTVFVVGAPGDGGVAGLARVYQVNASSILQEAGVPGSGLEGAPGLQKGFNPNGQGGANAGGDK